MKSSHENSIICYSNLNFYEPGMEKYISLNVARLSPVQCAVNLPEPAKVERDNTNGLLLRIVLSALVIMCKNI
jgi:hypothetical protein